MYRQSTALRCDRLSPRRTARERGISAVRSAGRFGIPASMEREQDARITAIQREVFEPGRSRFERYCDLVIGRRGWWAFLQYELILLCTALPGAVGLLLRSKLYPVLLGQTGRNVVFGSNVVLRHPHKIRIGDNVIVDDGCCLDAKGTDHQGITIGSGVFIGRNTILSCKNGDIVVEEGANIGFNCEIFSASRVRVGRKVLIAAYSYLVGGDHMHDRVDVPVIDQGRTAAGIDVDDNAWIGAHVVVADGARIGRDAVIGAGAVVIDEVPAFHIAAGVPARLVRDRRQPR